MGRIEPSKIWIVVAVYNRKALTIKCLESLHLQTIKGFKIIVVDDGSTDGSMETINQLFPRVTVIREAGNLWWTASMNIGVRHALEHEAMYVLSLNNDLEVAPDYIEKMIHWAEKKMAALLGSYIFNIQTGEPDWAGSRKDWKACRSKNILDLYPENNRKGIASVSHFCGRGLWIPAVVFHKLGFFDEKHLPQYCADDDFTFRAAKNGFEIFCNFDAKLYSHVSESGAEINKYDLSFSGYIDHLFGRKSFGNLKNFNVIAYRHCPRGDLAKYWCHGIAARILGFPLKIISSALKG